MRQRHRSAIALGLAAIGFCVHAQTPVTAHAGLIAGIVTSGDGRGTPVRRAIVTISGSGIVGSVQTASDENGHFAFLELPAGHFVLTAEKPGFVKTYYGSPRSGRGPGMPLILADGARIDDVRMPLVRGGVIAGAVLDEMGAPISSAQVRALQVVIVNGERRLVDPPGPQQLATTDDRGRYRVYGLPSGEYVVRSAGGGGLSGVDVRLTTADVLAAAARDGRAGPASAAGSLSTPHAAPPKTPQVSRGVVYAPGVPDAADAQEITLGAGEERTGVDIRSPLVRSARIEGVAVATGGEPVTNTLVGIANASTGTLWSSPGIVRPRADGHWELSAMLPGRYVFFGRGSVTPPGTNVPLNLWTETEVLVSEQDVSGVVLEFRPGTTVAGRLTFRGQTAPPDPAGLRVVLTQLPAIAGAATTIAPVTPQPDGSFSFAGVAPSRYRLSVTGAGVWVPRSAIVNGRDTLDAPLELTPGQDVRDIPLVLTDQPTELSGVLLDQTGRPAPEYAVIVLSANRNDWIAAPRRLSGIVRLTRDGRFSVIGLPPGEYVLAALTDLDPNQLTDPSLLEVLARSGVRLTLGEGEKKTQNVRLGGG